jgi:hypothetical protein
MPANAGIHVFLHAAKTWMAGTSPATTASYSALMPLASMNLVQLAISRCSFC